MPIDATSYLNTSSIGTSDGASRVPSKVLNQDDFLKLLITQMTSQDPMNPKADTDMAAQMAQFTSLEQSRSMASDLGSLLGQQQLLQANGMLGRVVELKVDAQTTVTGPVDVVQIQAGTPKIVVGGVAYDLSQVLQISPTAIGP